MLEQAESVRGKYEPVKIKEEAPWDEVALAEARQEDLPGVIVEPEHRRNYPTAAWRHTCSATSAK